MSDRVFAGTRKGLFELKRTRKGWDIADVQFLGDPVSAVLAVGDTVWAALDLGHFGAHLWRKQGSKPWREIGIPVYPQKPKNAKGDPHPWSLGRIWSLVPGGRKGRLWAGTMPGGLFRSDDLGNTWQLCEPLWRMPMRKKWMGVAGGEQPGLSTVLVDPRDPKTLRLGVSTAGVWETKDEGKTWALINQGMYNEYMPPESKADPLYQDIHQLAHCPGAPDTIWCQHHNGVFRSVDAGHHWTEVKAIKPSKFGFAVCAHPTDPNTAWFAPAIKDERRVPVDGKIVVARTRDGGKSFKVLSKGLPGRHAYDLVWRHGLAVDKTGERLAMGSTSGGFWVSEDAGESWKTPDVRLPPINFVRFAG